MTKKQKAIKFIQDQYLATSKLPSIEAIVEASGSTKSTVQSILATMRDVLGVAPEGAHGRESYYDEVVAAAKAGTLEKLTAKESTVRQHLNKALKNGDLKRVTSYV